MQTDKRRRLERAGWKVGNASEFLDLNHADSAVIEIRVALAEALRGRRRSCGVSQAAMAETLGSSQSRVAKMEAGDPSVSLDLLIRSLAVAGSTNAEIGGAIALIGSRAKRTRKSA
jgi:DNA-binding XRE family transcriptional regulator